MRQDQAEVTLKPPQASQVEVRLPSSRAAPGGNLIVQLEARGVDYRFQGPGLWRDVLQNVLLLVLLFRLPAALLAVLLAFWVRRLRKRRL